MLSSSAHPDGSDFSPLYAQIIILHRPFLGRAFADPAYQKSRDTCVLHARRILQFLRDCPLEQFRKTWTTLIHSVAAAVILILEVSHTQNASTDLDEPLELVFSAIDVFRSLRNQSTIADKGVRVLEQLLKDSAKRPGSQQFKRKAGGEAELERAIKALRRKSNLAGSASSASPPTTGQQAVELRHPHQTQATSLAPPGMGPPPQQQQQSPQNYVVSPSSDPNANPLSFPSPQQPNPSHSNSFHALGAFGFPSSGFSAPGSPHPGPFGYGVGQQAGPTGVWSPHLYNFASQNGQGGAGAGGYDSLFEGLNAFELSGLLEFEQAGGSGGV